MRRAADIAADGPDMKNAEAVVDLGCPPPSPPADGDGEGSHAQEGEGGGFADLTTG